jgi:hypothetical protein
MVFDGNRLLIMNELLKETEFIAIERLKERLKVPNPKIDRRGIDRDHLVPLTNNGIIEYGTESIPRNIKPPQLIDAVRIAHTLEALKLVVAGHPDILKLHNTHYLQSMINQELVETIKTDWGYPKDIDFFDQYPSLSKDANIGEIYEYYLSDKETEYIFRVSPTALKEALNPQSRSKKFFDEVILTSFMIDGRKLNFHTMIFNMELHITVFSPFKMEKRINSAVARL